MLSAMPIDLTHRLARAGGGAALASCLLNGVWLACMIGLAGQGDVAAQARAYPGVFRLGVGATLLIAVLQVPVLLGLAAVAFERAPARALIGGAVYALYIPINLIAYYLYGRLAPIVHAMPGKSLEVAAAIEIGHPLALTGALPILGYSLLGLGWCLLGSALWRRGRLWAAAAALLGTSGLLSFLGAAGGFCDVAWLTTCCMIGGMVSLPALAVAGVAMLRER